MKKVEGILDIKVKHAWMHANECEERYWQYCFKVYCEANGFDKRDETNRYYQNIVQEWMNYQHETPEYKELRQLKDDSRTLAWQAHYQCATKQHIRLEPYEDPAEERTGNYWFDSEWGQRLAFLRTRFANAKKRYILELLDKYVRFESSWGDINELEKIILKHRFYTEEELKLRGRLQRAEFLYFKDISKKYDELQARISIPEPEDVDV